ncbi:deleted in malignant brain tumors 1 protein-like [Pomacea canaliculata]|uniref:deleted in malignant brain tumors 1 protein-like n=1 Tax=Pomacea canaliculata TaxID=400727 RepID=UPI000D7261F1|nr:deleted in malignant brain tumors 1 protein-like [Pomacea canaliculata]
MSRIAFMMLLIVPGLALKTLDLSMEENENNASVIWNGTEQEGRTFEDLSGGSTSKMLVSPASVTEGSRDEELKARLVNGTANAGRLEIFYRGEWSTVCKDRFGNKAASVACRMLGFYSRGSVAVATSVYGAGTGRILLDDVTCQGTERSLAQCSHKTFYSHDCSHNEDVGVICNEGKQLVARLVNGTAVSGRLEIFSNGEWSTVCDDGFGNTEATVACRMLGFNGSGARVAAAGRYGAGAGRILLDEVKCQGSESSLAECNHTKFYSGDCSHNEDVGLFCKEVISLSSCNTSRKYLEVKEGRSDNEFTCTGLTAQEDVRWFFRNNIIFCSLSPSLRPIKCLTRLTENRTSDTVSVATIDASENSDPNYIGTAILTCQTATATISCPMDSVYPAENSSCQVQFGDNKVTAWCSVSKVRSARNNYVCSLYQALEASQATLVGSYAMDVVPASSGYFSGTCNMTSYLPPEGQYSYYVIIMPGEVNVSATFIGSSIISRPRGTPDHNCPPNLKEGDTLNCSCFVNDFGNPPGVIRWNGTYSDKLEFKNLTKLQNGIQNVCSLTWNNTVHQSVSYTLLVLHMDYPAENSSCQVQFKDNKVTAWCSVSKVWSSRNDYRCSLYLAPEASQATLVGSSTMGVVPASSGYFSGTCNMTSNLPPEGIYSYYVTIMPGEVSVSATITSNSFIISPPTARLANGDGMAGRLELFYKGEWSTVCGDGFRDKEARVACRMLGFNSSGGTAVTSSLYGAGAGIILLDDVNCLGTESSLVECDHSGFYSHNCRHSEDVGVICNEDIQLTARLADGDGNGGRLELFHNGEWNSVCGDGFGIQEARVACRMLGFNSSTLVAATSDEYGSGVGRIILDGVRCTGTEKSLLECNHKALYQPECEDFQAGVICKEVTKPTTNTTITKVSSSPRTTAPKQDSSSETTTSTTTTTTEKVTKTTTTTTSRNGNGTTVTTSTTTTSTTTTVTIQP